MGYITNFIVYTLAMVGIVVVALLVFKNATSFGTASKSRYLRVIDSMSLGPRKTLYIVSTGREKFLIAGDVDKTTLISKLNSQESVELKEESVKTDYSTDTNIGINSSILSNQTKSANHSVIKTIADILRK